METISGRRTRTISGAPIARNQGTQFPKVYSREKTIPKPKQAQESNSDPGNEITVRSDPPLHTQLGETSTDSIDNLDLPIAIRKGTRECTNRPLYPLSHYVFLKHLSLAHKTFIMSLNIANIPNTVSEALAKSEWKDAMREEMSALEKNKTWEIIERLKGKTLLIASGFSHLNIWLMDLLRDIKQD